MTNDAITFTMEPIYPLNVRGMHLPKILKPFSLQIIRSMCIRLLAILLVRVEAEADTLFFLIIGGAERRTPWIARRS